MSKVSICIPAYNNGEGVKRLLSSIKEQSYTDYEIACPSGEYQMVLNTDAPEFGGFGNVDQSVSYTSRLQGGKTSVRLYLPSRTAVVLKKQ